MNTIRRSSRVPAGAPLLPASEQDPYYESLVGLLGVDVAHLEQELASQAELLHRAGREVGRLSAVVAARRRELRAIRARVDGMLRRSAREQGTDVTDRAVRVQVGDHAEVVRAARALDDARQRALSVKLLGRAFRQRGRMLEALVALRTRK